MKIKLFFLFAFLIAFMINAKTQCPSTMSISASDKCLQMAWTTPPVPLPASISYNSNTYNWDSGSGTSGSPAVYSRVTNPNCGSFSPFTGTITIGGSSCTYSGGVLQQSMPLTMISFTSEIHDGQIVLFWSTQEETNLKGFSIERAGKEMLWHNLDFVDSRQENSYNISNYNFIDESPMKGDNYYRLRITDKDGNTHYSKITMTENKNTHGKVSIFPNPVTDKFYISSSYESEILNLSLYDARGTRLKTTINMSQGIDMKNYQTGIYIVKICFVNGESEVLKLIK